jgi:hypothetical protein
MLARGWQRSCDFYMPTIGIDGATGWSGPNYVVLKGSVTTPAGGFGQYLEYVSSSASYPLISFYSPTPCSRIDIYYWDSTGASGQTWTCAGDVNAQSVTITLAGSNSMKTQTFNFADSTKTHFVLMGNPSNGSSMRILGFGVYQPNFATNTGLAFSRCSPGGDGYAFNYGAGAVIPPSSGGLTQWNASTPIPYGSDLNILVANDDLISGVGLDSSARCLELIIKALRKGNQGCSIIIVLPAPTGDLSDGATQLYAPVQYWLNNMRMIQQLSESYNCLCVNIMDWWSSLGLELAYQVTNNNHPTDLGHQNIADMLMQVL